MLATDKNTDKKQDQNQPALNHLGPAEQASNRFDQINHLIESYLKVVSLRGPVLFFEFLKNGYQITTIDSVRSVDSAQVVFAKMHVGMLITLYDDLADNPVARNPKLLSALYELNVGRNRRGPLGLSPEEQEVFELARNLFLGLEAALSGFKNANLLMPVLKFDFEQFYICNRHAELMAQMPSVSNLTESKTLGPYNMGIVAAGVIDLMASLSFEPLELGRCREVFIKAQRMGRISNVLFTYAREIAEGDVTNEVLVALRTAGESEPANYGQTLLSEFTELAASIESAHIRSFDLTAYVQGFRQLHALHARLEGKI